ncbi:lycopene cyclase domain-containing protein [Frigoribacterium sp. PhB118]|uniref:lycopene cyclase domain-containing protein n=1 Tax=Frigoribacterium sp. PhB118 TaxID=2485175 RepID=UPI000FA8E7CB|nr:lycopene cyclase domain-containing protein [Frigoribacterium sp. PhB118]ROS53635.1 lycopene cyclase domain-containing protein [Frigoribacterium sp. PhB118]
MTYWAVNAVFLSIVAVLGVLALVTAGVRGRAARASSSPAERSRRRREQLLGAGLATGVLLVMTAVFDNVMIGIGLVGYDAARISGVFVGIAPLEDFAYAVAALVLLPSVWVLLGGPKTPRGPAAPAAGGSTTVEEARS